MVRLAPQALANWEKTVQEVHRSQPDLRPVTINGRLGLRGSFAVAYAGEVLDRYVIEIEFPEGIAKLPAIREIGGRIPRTAARHVFNGGAICTEVPELTLLRGYSLPSYLDGPVRNYFLGQGLVERGERWPFGERNHNKPGLIEAYGEILGVSGEPAVGRYLDVLAHKKVKRHWPCPCGSGRPIRECHDKDIRKLQAAVPSRIARQAIARLDFYS